jgi:parallel beta-helix repeat protein
MKRSLGVSLATAAAALATMAGSAGAATTCDLVASPTGSDSAAGTAAAPFQSAEKLVSSLAPGQTGCLHGGTYDENVKVSQGGNAGAPVTLTSYPGETATVVGRFWVARGADYVTVSHLNLDGRNSQNLPSPTITANHATFSYDDVTDDHTAICFSVGDSTWGAADGTLITDSRVHDCGIMPAHNYNHGIYVDDATNTTISWNEIYNNSDRGVQLYPNAQHTTVDHNIITGNGENILFSGDDGQASSGADVYDNILADARVRNDVESWWPSGNPVGTGNQLHNNCVWGGREGTIDTSSGGFSSYANQTVNPQFANASAGNFHLPATSPCLAMTGDVAAAINGTTPTIPVGSKPPTGGHRHTVTRKPIRGVAARVGEKGAHAKRHAKRHAKPHHPRGRRHARRA